MADLQFENPRLAEIYDLLDLDRSDLEVYAALVDELGAQRVLDVGCGTGTLACLLARRAKEVIGVDPAAASLDVARRKEGADRVGWLHGDIRTASPPQVDLVIMTGNVAQVFVTEEEWAQTLGSAYAALRPGGWLVFESRDPRARAWREWNRHDSYYRAVIPVVGTVKTWVELLDLQEDLVSFRSTFVFERDGTTLTSDSTLRFRCRDELVDTLSGAKLVVQEVRDAPDRPGKELVFIARRGE